MCTTQPNTIDQSNQGKPVPMYIYVTSTTSERIEQQEESQKEGSVFCHKISWKKA